MTHVAQRTVHIHTEDQGTVVVEAGSEIPDDLVEKVDASVLGDEEEEIFNVDRYGQEPLAVLAPSGSEAAEEREQDLRKQRKQQMEKELEKREAVEQGTPRRQERKATGETKRVQRQEPQPQEPRSEGGKR